MRYRARKQAGETAVAPLASGGILLVGLILIATLIASFIATTKTSTALGKRTSPAHHG